MEYKTQIENQENKKLHAFNDGYDEKDGFDDLCNYFLEITSQSNFFSKYQILMIIFNKINEGLTESEKNLFFERQVYSPLLYYFLNPSLIEIHCNELLHYILIRLYEQYEAECDFFLTEEFIQKLTIEATTYPKEHDSSKSEEKILHRSNKLLTMIIKNHHDCLPIQFIIEKFCESISNIHIYDFFITLRQIVKTKEAIFEYCAPIYPHLQNLFDIKNDHYLERSNYCQLMITLFRKGGMFQHFFYETIEIRNLFEILLENNDDFTLFSKVFKMFTILLNQESFDLALKVYDIIDQKVLFSQISQNVSSNYYLFEINDYLFYICQFYQSIFSRFPQFFNSIDLNIFFDFFFYLCKFKYKIKIEAIHSLCLICCFGPSHIIQILVNKGVITQILSIIDDECPNALLMVKAIKVIFDYSIKTKNKAIQDEIFQDDFVDTMDSIIQKPEFEGVAYIWNSILEMKS